MNQIDTRATPKVSIIVPVYRVQDYLPKCLDSLISQTHKNIEIILVDDGSTDNSLSICSRYAEKDSRIQIITQDNSGVTAARMNGFYHSHGEWIMFVDADDYVSPNIVEFMLQAQHKYQVDIVSCQYYDVKKERAIPSPIRPDLGYYNRERIECLLSTNFLYDNSTGIAGMSGFLWGKLFKKDFVHMALNAGVGLIHSEDQIGLFKVLYSINSMYVMQKPLYYYVVRQGQATRSYHAAYWKNFEQFFTRIKEIDTENYLRDQLPCRVVGILNSLVRMEFANNALPFYQRYCSVKKNFSDVLCKLGSTADTSRMGLKTRIEYLLQVHHAFFLYGMVSYLYEIIKSLKSNFSH